MRGILHAADSLLSLGEPPDLAADMLADAVLRLHQPFVDQISPASLDPRRLAEFIAADGMDLDEARELRTAPLHALLADALHDLDHTSPTRQQRRKLERQARSIQAAIDRAERRFDRETGDAGYRLDKAEAMLRDAPHAPVPPETVPLDIATAATREAIMAAVQGTGPRHVLIPAWPALGKTHLAVTLAAEHLARPKREARDTFIRDWRYAHPFRPYAESREAANEAGHKRARILYLGETHALLAQTVKLARQSGMTAAHLGGMTRPVDPADMTSPASCTQPKRVELTRDAGESVPDKGCGRGADGPHCPDLGICQFWQRWREAAHAEFVAMPIDHATRIYLASELRNFDLIIIDEAADRAIYGAALVPLDNLSDRHFAPHPVRTDGEPDEALTAEARRGYRLVRDAFDAAPDGYAPRFEAAFLARMLALTEARDVPSGIDAATSDDDRGELSRASFRRRARGLCGMFRQLAAGAGFVRLKTDGERRTAIVRTIRDLHPSIAASRILVLDATANGDDWRRMLPELAVIAVPAPDAPHETAVQIVIPMGKRAMRSPTRMATARAIAALYGHGETGVLTHMEHADSFADVGPVGWFGAVAGLNRFEAVRTMLTFGLPSLSPEAAAYEGAARTGEAVPVEMPRRVLVPAWMRDRTAQGVPSMEFTHPAARAAQAAWRERQAVQGPGGRPRAIRRTAANPLLSLYVGTTPVPNLRYAAVIRGPGNLASERSLRMIAGGFAFQSATMRHRLLPGIYPQPWTADYDIARERGDDRDAQAAFLAMLRRVIAPSWHPGPREAWAIVKWFRVHSQGNRLGGELAACPVRLLPELRERLRTVGATLVEVIADIQPKAADATGLELDRNAHNQDVTWVLPTSWRGAPGTAANRAEPARGPPDG